MKVLWIVNKPTGKLHKIKMGKKATGGLWLEAMIERAKEDAEIEVVIVNIDNVNKIEKVKDDNIVYYTIPGNPSVKYDFKSVLSREHWRKIFQAEKPDLIELWGTEMPYGLAALPESLGIPSVIFVQGIMEAIGKYYTAGMTDQELRSAISLRDFFTGNTIRRQQYRNLKSSSHEKQIVGMCKRIIVENLWSEGYYKKMCQDVKVYKCPLCISQVFQEFSWTLEKMKRHTIMCPAANYPIKGLHMLLKAIQLVKIQYPDVKLYIPGTPLRELKSLKEYLKQNGYEKFIRAQIKDLGLSDSIIYIGRLTAREMAEKMSESNCFVMCSAIENHSSTLKEAMTVGVPCVSSYVGGVPEYAVDGKNCLLYRFEDYEVLALQIIRLFQSDDLCQQLSTNATESMDRIRKEKDFYLISKEIYKEILSET